MSSSLTIPMDPLNPGQFFACCGLFELVAQESGLALSHFEVDENRPRHAHFVIEGEGLPTLEVLLASLGNTTLEMVRDGEESVWPVRLSVNGRVFELDWWLDTFREESVILKCWAGQVTTEKLFTELPKLVASCATPNDLLRASALTKSKFGVDPRSAWNTLDLGFSPNAHQKDAATYPAVEVLAAIGLQGFRPIVKRREAPYHLWTIPLPLSVARMAAVAPWNGLPRFDYTFSIRQRGQSYKYFALGQFVERKA